MPALLLAMLSFAIGLLGVGGFVTLLLRARHLYVWPKGRRHGGLFARYETTEADVRMAALTAYQKLAEDKIDVLKRAIDLGWKDADLKALDARLEQLVGKEELRRIASGGLPSTDLEGIALTPEQELALLKQKTQ